MRTWKQDHGDEIGWKPGGYCFPVYTEALERTLRAIGWFEASTSSVG